MPTKKEMPSDSAMRAAEKIYSRHTTWRYTDEHGDICESDIQFKPRWIKNAARIINKEISNSRTGGRNDNNGS